MNTIRRKKTHEWVKEELVNSFRENEAVEEPGFNRANVTDPGEAITHMNSYEDII